MSILVDTPIECKSCKVIPARDHGQPCDREWVEFPDGLRLVAVPYWGIDPCNSCGTPRDYSHHDGCPEEVCPRCNDRLLFCGCLVTVEAMPDIPVEEIKEGIDLLATAYHGGQPTKVAHIGIQHPVMLRAKFASFREMYTLKVAGANILSRYPDTLLETWTKNGGGPSAVKNAHIMLNRASRLWESNFWK